MSQLTDAIHAKLDAAFSPTTLRVEDESDQHAGHAGHAQHAADGGDPTSHVAVTIAAAGFADMSRLARHRAVLAEIEAEVARLHAIRFEISD